VEVWTWQSGVDTALYSFIDLDQVEAGGQHSVPVPQVKAIPTTWREAGSHFGQSGTIVVWSALDRSMWKTAQAIVKNSEMVIGRMYRKFLERGGVVIRMASFTDDHASTFDIDRTAVANDPGYLMVPSSTPHPYDTEAMFEPEGDRWEVEETIEFHNAHHVVTTRFTVAKAEARNRSGPSAGATDYGRHAKNNIGVSLMRADRELELEQSLVNGYDPRERWWGVEIEFPPALDELFGVTNNKQSARHFSDLANAFEAVLSGAGSIADLKAEMAEDEDPAAPLIDILHLVDRRLKQLRKVIQIQGRETRGGRRRHADESPEARATQVTKERQEQGHHGSSDADEQLPDDERKAALSKELTESGLSPDQANELAAKTIEDGIKYTFADADLEGRAFFTVKPVAGEIVVKLNINHPAYTNLVEVLEGDAHDELDPKELADRLNKAAGGLRLLLMAWARFEDEAFPVSKREDIQDLRTEWGKYAAFFLER